MCFLQREYIVNPKLWLWLADKSVQDLAVYEQFNGIVLADKEGKDIARALGKKKAVLLRNHGLLTVGETIEAAVFWFVYVT